MHPPTGAPSTETTSPATSQALTRSLAFVLQQMAWPSSRSAQRPPLGARLTKWPGGVGSEPPVNIQQEGLHRISRRTSDPRMWTWSCTPQVERPRLLGLLPDRRTPVRRSCADAPSRCRDLHEPPCQRRGNGARASAEQGTCLVDTADGPVGQCEVTVASISGESHPRVHQHIVKAPLPPSALAVHAMANPSLGNSVDRPQTEGGPLEGAPGLQDHSIFSGGSDPDQLRVTRFTRRFGPIRTHSSCRAPSPTMASVAAPNRRYCFPRSLEPGRQRVTARQRSRAVANTRPIRPSCPLATAFESRPGPPACPEPRGILCRPPRPRPADEPRADWAPPCRFGGRRGESTEGVGSRRWVKKASPATEGVQDALLVSLAEALRRRYPAPPAGVEEMQRGHRRIVSRPAPVERTHLQSSPDRSIRSR